MKRYLNARPNFAPDGWQARTRLLSTGAVEAVGAGVSACMLSPAGGNLQSGNVPGLFGRARRLFGVFSTIAIPV